MTRRASPLVVHARLEDAPLEARGIAEISRGPVRGRGLIPHSARIERLRARLADGRAGSEPSLLIEAPAPEPDAPAPQDPREVCFEWDGDTLRGQVRLPRGTHAYGLGLVCGPLAHHGRRVVFWNTDAWRHDERTPSLYQTHPWVLALLSDGRAVGVLADCAARGQAIVFEDGLEFAFEQPFDLYLVEGAHPIECLRALGDLVGTTPLPPLWALGYHQCRWGYRDAASVLAVARRFREHGLPCDALWLDIDHMHRHRSLTFDAQRFPDPAGLVRELDGLGLSTVAIVDPGLEASADCELFIAARDGDHLVEAADGSPALGRVWPGVSAFPDFSAPRTRQWWSERIRDFVARQGLSGIWCDMNEPAVQRTPRGTLPDGARQRGFGGLPHARVHNLYGAQMAEATRAGLAAARSGRRPFVLTRSNHLGGARHAACWTGDNQSTWRDLAWSIPMVLNLGLSGQPFSGADVGGFEGDPSPELLERWFALGALLPFFRGHSHCDAGPKEPWAFGSEVEARVRAALELRMRLLPLLYTLFAEATRTGLPVVRPLFLHDPLDPALRTLDDAFLLGADLLVAPALEAGQRRRALRLPRGGWYELASGERLPLEGEVVLPLPDGTPILLARAGSIVPLGNARPSSRAPLEELTLLIHLDAEGRAWGELYEDAGDGPPSGPSRRTRWSARTEGGELVLETEHEGAFVPAPRRQIEAVRGAARPLVLRREPWRAPQSRP